jgi:hypothetical protein
MYIHLFTWDLDLNLIASYLYQYRSTTTFQEYRIKHSAARGRNAASAARVGLELTGLNRFQAPGRLGVRDVSNGR